jgi:hypothetical protein
MRTVIEIVGGGVVASDMHPGQAAHEVVTVMKKTNDPAERVCRLLGKLLNSYGFYSIPGDGVTIISVDLDDTVEVEYWDGDVTCYDFDKFCEIYG